jgi:hypothetical protein
MSLREEFIEELRLIIKQGYSPELAAKYAFDFYLKQKITDKNLYDVIENIMVIDAGPEFEMTECEIKELVKEKLKIDIDK